MHIFLICLLNRHYVGIAVFAYFNISPLYLFDYVYHHKFDPKLAFVLHYSQLAAHAWLNVTQSIVIFR